MYIKQHPLRGCNKFRQDFFAGKRTYTITVLRMRLGLHSSQGNTMKYFLSAALCAFLLSTAQAEIPPAQKIQKEEMVNHLVGIQNLFQSVYAPEQWKKQYAGWDIKTAVKAATNKIYSQPKITLKDYHEILVHLFNSPKDYHVGIYFHSTEAAALPFRVRGAEGRYFVAWVHPEVEEGFPLRKGDEIISFGGRPIQSEIRSLISSDRPDLITDTDIEQACMFLTMRLGALGHRVPQGSIEIAAKAKDGNSQCRHLLTWNYREELIKGLSPENLGNAAASPSIAPRNIYEAIGQFNIHANMSYPTAKIVAKKFGAKAYGAFPVGDRRGPFPYLGQPLWTAFEEKFFFAYLFELDEHKTIGYLRIPHFMGSEELLFQEEPDFMELRQLIRFFQKHTDALVIDLVDNSGGYWHILLKYLSTLSPTPLPLFRQRVSITQEDVATSLSIIEEIDGFLEQDISEAEKTYLLQVRQYFAFLYEEWNKGHTLTDPVFLYGVEAIVPDPIVTYTKPILLLINGLDFSCADIFPAVLQDSQRAHLFGSRTAGAGGEVHSHSYPNRLGIASYTYTGSILERNNHQPLENLGVIPDTFYQVTADDLQNEYEGYRKAVLKALKELLAQ